MKPRVKIKRNARAKKYPTAPDNPKETAHGNKTATSKSKIINKIATI